MYKVGFSLLLFLNLNVSDVQALSQSGLKEVKVSGAIKVFVLLSLLFLQPKIVKSTKAKAERFFIKQKFDCRIYPIIILTSDYSLSIMSSYRRRFNSSVLQHRSLLRRFLSKIQKDPPLLLDIYADAIEKEVWAEVNCLSCSNCCRRMTPTYTFQDLKRISAHLGMTIKAYKEKWLYLNNKGEWMNKSQPCQFLDLKTNMCAIYEVRPADCAGFPHLTKKKMVEYMHVHKQNVEYCPATFTMVKKLMKVVKEIEGNYEL